MSDELREESGEENNKYDCKKKMRKWLKLNILSYLLYLTIDRDSLDLHTLHPLITHIVIFNVLRQLIG